MTSPTLPVKGWLLQPISHLVLKPKQDAAHAFTTRECLWPPNEEKAPLEMQPQWAGSLTEISTPLCKLGPKVSHLPRDTAQGQSSQLGQQIPHPHLSAKCPLQGISYTAIHSGSACIPTPFCLEKLPL